MSRADLVIKQLTLENFDEAVEIVLKSKLDTREEIEEHLKHLEAHFIAKIEGRIVGVIGWYQDNVNYATEAMGGKFPGEEAYWVGFFAVDEQYRGKGVGTELLNHLAMILKKVGVDELWVSSVPESKSYYQHHDFKTVIKGEISGKQRFFLVKYFHNKNN